MTAASLPASAQSGSVWRTHISALVVVGFAIGLLFARDVADMVAIWWTASTFQHCLFIPFLIGWLVQQRLPGVRALTPQPWAPGLAWMGLGAFAWLLGEAAGVALFRQGGVIVMMQGAVMALLGPVVSRGLAFPLFYAFFMVPFGEEIVPALQLLTAHLSMAMLALAGVPAHMEGVFITTPGGYFKVAEACSGAKFVIAMTAYGVLVANVCFRRWSRRILFVTGALTLSVIANGVRAFATMMVAQMHGIDAAKGFDHVLFGWLFFGIVIALVMAAAWPFFDRRPTDPWFDPAAMPSPSPRTMALGYAVPAAIALLAAAPAWSALSAVRQAALPDTVTLPNVPGWARSGAPQAYGWAPRFAGADRFLMGRYANAQGQVVDLAVVLYARQNEGRELVGFGQGAIAPDSAWAWTQPMPAPPGARGERITAPGPVVRDVMTFYRVGGVLTGSGTNVKLATLKVRLLGGDQRAVAVMISAEERAGQSAQAAMASFLRALGPVQDLADASAGIR
ncbi:exosortase A [Sphingobium algorifonticola]|uniref:EpsI family protein n=1 Tax=Sphingobium algorifonticola TaxID=2008318 RepID=A0A437J6T9_9SPHN|nr:exosortase A [Sphingobium algorifonticola]RVT40893.1 EpsI family protein [Sphingobium algorifonticola]